MTLSREQELLANGRTGESRTHIIQLRYYRVEAEAGTVPKFPVFPGCQIGCDYRDDLEFACHFRCTQVIESALTIIGIGRAGGD